MNYQDKYFSDKDIKVDNLYYPGGVDDVPFRGERVPHLRQDEFDNLKLVYDCKTKLLDLDKTEDLEFYNSIIDKCAKGLSVLRHEMFHPTQTWRVLLQWLDKYNEESNSNNGASYARQNF